MSRICYACVRRPKWEYEWHCIDVPCRQILSTVNGLRSFQNRCSALRRRVGCRCPIRLPQVKVLSRFPQARAPTRETAFRLRSAESWLGWIRPGPACSVAWRGPGPYGAVCTASANRPASAYAAASVPRMAGSLPPESSTARWASSMASVPFRTECIGVAILSATLIRQMLFLGLVIYLTTSHGRAITCNSLLLNGSSLWSRCAAGRGD